MPWRDGFGSADADSFRDSNLPAPGARGSKPLPSELARDSDTARLSARMCGAVGAAAARNGGDPRALESLAADGTWDRLLRLRGPSVANAENGSSPRPAAPPQKGSSAAAATAARARCLIASATSTAFGSTKRVSRLRCLRRTQSDAIALAETACTSSWGQLSSMTSSGVTPKRDACLSGNRRAVVGAERSSPSRRWRRSDLWARGSPGAADSVRGPATSENRQPVCTLPGSGEGVEPLAPLAGRAGPAGDDGDRA
mmetsp:Transcript_4191/g.17734  ORF Transcript_4191/g.17734 Transcript_4191/m.17734 type:complete len:256 (-) Transcript_4191:447-1214(-)